MTTTTKENKGEVPSIIAADLKIVGNLMCGGSIEIEGEIEGNVTCGSATIRRTGAIKGDVTADSIQVDGEINGLVKGKDIVLSESGKVTGVIMYESLSVKDGAYIDGQCKSADNLHRGNVETLDVTDSNAIEDNMSGSLNFVNDKRKEEVTA
ncbi:MAG: polymer-forming cytoskeletal protein [Rickettsiales bacterium]|nr:polymer-forming cytoskeletal protein [Pseudomonadota bacterium]MDG4544246.1 polymer-forming cytoskeletal protein [Rickettsiales bacterium]MDG4546425.1 polymer-forming cytoskeletal protein [Rickettsiales bacterium]MDG4548571.1 polymer-forming cytoskeletal protein [Rickettsiales bacterium]